MAWKKITKGENTDVRLNHEIQKSGDWENLTKDTERGAGNVKEKPDKCGILEAKRRGELPAVLHPPVS